MYTSERLLTRFLSALWNGWRGAGQLRGASGQYAETDRSFLADDSPGDHSGCSGQETGKQRQQSRPVLHCAFQKLS